MAKIARKSQLIFGSSSSNNGQFGSAVAGTFDTSADPAVLQALPAWLSGWAAATVSGQNLPTLEEIQGVMYVLTYQLAYLFQEGVPEYDVGTTYFINSVVKKTGTYELYGSKIDNNTNHALPVKTTDANWTFLGSLDQSSRVVVATPADTSPDISALNGADGLVTLVAATVYTITDFDGWRVPGQTIKFKNTGASTVTIDRTHANLIGGANQAIATNQFISLTWDGAKWNQNAAVVTIS